MANTNNPLQTEMMNTKLTHTRNSLPKSKRIEMAALLQARLAESIDLMMQAKQAHEQEQK
jgi:hypothetical protein